MSVALSEIFYPSRLALLSGFRAGWLGAIIILSGLLAGCGGADSTQPIPISSDSSTGSSSGSSGTSTGATTSDSSNSAPLANAGANISTVSGATITLSGTAKDTDGEIKTILWTQVSGTTATISDADELDATVVIPSVTASETLRFRLTVTDDDGSTDQDDVNVSIIVSDGSSSTSSGLVVDAGDDQVVVAGEEVTLSASAYSSLATSYSYSWEQTSGSTVTLSADTGREVTFVAPLNSTTSNSLGLRFQLTVEDSTGASRTDTTLVSVFNELSAPTGLTVTASTASLVLTWTAVTGAEAYDVYYANESFSTLSTLDNYAALDGGTLKAYQQSTTTFTLTDFAVSTVYYFIVVARRGVYISDPSAEVSQTSSSTSDSSTGTGGTGSTGGSTGDTGTATGNLNDSGQVYCYDEKGAMGKSDNDCSETSIYPNQDGQFGRDRKDYQGTLTKTGAGVAGFDFTKIGSTGTALAASETEPACVLDNVTGLMWEGKGKTTSSTLIAEVRNDYQYSWYYDDAAVSGGIPGNEKIKGGSFTCSITYCNISAHVDALNEAAWCGRTNWRVPWLTDLATIIHYGAKPAPMIDTDYFPYVEGEYWTLSIQVLLSYEGTTGTNAWVVDFDTGEFGVKTKTNPAKVMAVSGD